MPEALAGASCFARLGAAQRVDLQLHKELIAEHQALSAEYARVQERVSLWSQERSREQAAWDRERLQLRAVCLGLQTQLDQAREQLSRWQALSPALPERLALQQRLAEQTERAQSLQRELNRLLQAQSLSTPANAMPRLAATRAGPVPPPLEQQVVLCVGGRSGTVPLYRRAVEGCGAQFLHHDGGAEHKPAQLEPQLAAADLVICQTGCISHDAYWRVKDHCKRHGKRCVFVDAPGRSAFERALLQAAGMAT